MPEIAQPIQQQCLSQQFVIAGEMASIPPARDAIMSFVEPHCRDQQQQIDILLALQEGLANAVLHGCHNDSTKSVHCTVEITPSAFHFVIQDPGEGFPTALAADITEDGTNLTEHGRGILLIRSLMDEVSYRRNGSELRMTKRRSIS